MVSERVTHPKVSPLGSFFLRIGFKVIDHFCSVLERRFGLVLGYRLTNITSSVETFSKVKNAHFLEINLGAPSIANNTKLLNPFGDQVAIILQGAIGNNQKTLASVISRYRLLFPFARIILSTWENENTDFVQSIENIHVIKSIQPTNPGISNTNLQLVSSRVGIELADQLGCKYVIKSRTDQMLLNSTFLVSLHGFVSDKSEHLKESRIVISSFNTFCFRKYSISDMFTFGPIDEMKKLWFVPLDSRDPKEIRSIKLDDKDSWSRLRVAENYIFSLYLENKGLVLDFTFEQYFKALTEYFIVIDSADLGQSWSKYTHFNPIYNQNNFPHSRSEVTSTIWRSLPTIGSELARTARSLENVSA
jgi:hypothetical protein